MGTYRGDVNLYNDRGLAQYQTYFGPDFGKKPEYILDVGSGAANAARAIANSPDHQAIVVGVDPAYSKPERRQALSGVLAVAGEDVNLPFASDTFDRIVSSWALAYFNRSINTHNVYEMMRVAKIGGRIMLQPAVPFLRPPPDVASKVRFGSIFATLDITKPDDFYDWSTPRQHALYAALARCVSFRVRD